MRHIESKMQQACVRWFKYTYPRVVIFSIPNGALLAGNALQRVKQWNRLQAEGALKGIPDLMVLYNNGKHNGLFIEMKTSSGKLSQDQKVVHAALINLGYAVRVVRSVEDFVTLVQSYIKKHE